MFSNWFCRVKAHCSSSGTRTPELPLFARLAHRVERVGQGSPTDHPLTCSPSVDCRTMQVRMRLTRRSPKLASAVSNSATGSETWASRKCGRHRSRPGRIRSQRLDGSVRRLGQTGQGAWARHLRQGGQPPSTILQVDPSLRQNLASGRLKAPILSSRCEDGL